MSFNNTKTPNKPIGKAKWQVPMRPHHKGGKDEYYLEGELKERFCKLFPKNSNRRMMAWFGISFSTVQRFKREFGLEKDMKAIRKQQAKDIKKICERNGYYASLRGKKPSEASIEAIRQLRAAGFPPVEAAQSQQSAQIQATDAQEERAAQGAISQRAAACLLRTGASDQPPHPHQSALAQGYGTKARHDKMLKLLCRPIRRPSHHLLRQRDAAVSTTGGHSRKAWIEGGGSG